MTLTIDDFTPVEKTLLITVTGRALDARTANPILGDRLAAEAFDRLGPHAGIIKVPGYGTLSMAVRSKMLDRIVAGFIDAHLNAVVVELGCGLEPACTALPHPQPSGLPRRHRGAPTGAPRTGRLTSGRGVAHRSRLVLRTVGIPKAFRGWGFDDPREVERLNRRLTFVEEQIGDQAPEVT